MRNPFKIFLLAIVLVLIAACIKPYQPDIQQGNIINNSDLREIRYGMNKQEVLFILGTPMVIDPFNESRWDYFYSKTDQRKNETEKRLITVIFRNDKLIELRGDVDLRKVQTLEPSIEDMQHGGTVITKPTRKEKGILNRIFSNKKSIGDKKKRDKKEAKTEDE